MQVCQSGKKSEKGFFFQVSEKSGNFNISLESFEKNIKVREFKNFSNGLIADRLLKSIVSMNCKQFTIINIKFLKFIDSASINTMDDLKVIISLQKLSGNMVKSQGKVIIY